MGMVSDQNQERSQEEIAAKEAFEKKMKAQPAVDIAPASQQEEDVEVLRWAEEQAEAGGFDSVKDMLQKTGWSSAGEMRAVQELTMEAEEAAETDADRAAELQERLLKALSPEETTQAKPVEVKNEKLPTEFESGPTDVIETGGSDTFLPPEERVARPPRPESKPATVGEDDVTEIEGSRTARELAEDEDEDIHISREVSGAAAQRVERLVETPGTLVAKQEKKSTPGVSSEEIEALKLKTPEKVRNDAIDLLSKSPAELFGGKFTPDEIPEKYMEKMRVLGKARDMEGDPEIQARFEEKRQQMRNYLDQRMGLGLPESVTEATVERGSSKAAAFLERLRKGRPPMEQLPDVYLKQQERDREVYQKAKERSLMSPEDRAALDLKEAEERGLKYADKLIKADAERQEEKKNFGTRAKEEGFTSGMEKKQTEYARNDLLNRLISLQTGVDNISGQRLSNREKAEYQEKADLAKQDLIDLAGGPEAVAALQVTAKEMAEQGRSKRAEEFLERIRGGKPPMEGEPDAFSDKDREAYAIAKEKTITGREIAKEKGWDNEQQMKEANRLFEQLGRLQRANLAPERQEMIRAELDVLLGELPADELEEKRARIKHDRDLKQNPSYARMMQKPTREQVAAARGQRVEVNEAAIREERSKLQETLNGNAAQNQAQAK